jgi:hypothetical protein
MQELQNQGCYEKVECYRTGQEAKCTAKSSTRAAVSRNLTGKEII